LSRLPRNRDRSLRLDVELLLEAHPEGSLDYLDTLQILQTLDNLAFRDLNRAEDVRCLVEGEDGLGRVVLDPEVACRFLEGVPISSRQQEDRFLLVPDLAPLPRQDWLVVPDELDDVVPRDVRRP